MARQHFALPRKDGRTHRAMIEAARGIRSPLLAAVLKLDETVIRALASLGASIVDPEALLSPTSWAAKLGSGEIVRLLHSLGGHLVASNMGEWSPLMCAPEHGFLTTVRVLLSLGASTNETAANRGTAMLVAAQEGHGAVVRELASHGGDVEAKRLRLSSTALLVAAPWQPRRAGMRR